MLTPHDPFFFDSQFHYETRWQFPHRDCLTIHPSDMSGWEDTAGGRQVMAELAARGMDREDIQVIFYKGMGIVAGPEWMLAGGISTASFLLNVETFDRRSATSVLLDAIQANVVRDRMIKAVHGPDTEIVPLFALQTTYLLETLMMWHRRTSADLMQLHRSLWSEDQTLSGSKETHGDVRDALPVGGTVRYNDVTLLFEYDRDDISLEQHDETTLTMQSVRTPADADRLWVGRRVREIRDLGAEPIDLAIGDAEVKEVYSKEGEPAYLSLWSPVMTMAPIPDVALAAAGITDAGPAARRFPLWTTVSSAQR